MILVIRQAPPVRLKFWGQAFRFTCELEISKPVEIAAKIRYLKKAGKNPSPKGSAGSHGVMSADHLHSRYSIKRQESFLALLGLECRILFRASPPRS